MVIKMLAITVIAEVLIMLLFPHLPLPELNEFGYAIADGLLLGLLVVPVFYYFLILPVKREVVLEQEDRHLLHDELTGLPQSVLFEEVVEHEVHEAAREMDHVSLILVDPGGMSAINQEMGFQVGDKVLVHVATAIQEACRDSDIVARIKGDLFAVLVPHANAARANMIEAKIRHAVDKSFDVDGIIIDVVSTTGVSVCPDHADSAEDLIRCANAALGHAKHERISSAIYEKAKSTAASRRIETFSRLRQAINNNQFELFYQPKIDLKTNMVSGAEALIRWTGEHGCPPDEFIPIAEQTGLISEITAWVAKEAVRQCKVWDGGGIRINIAINVSTRNLYDAQFVEMFETICGENQLDPSRITVEVTESAVMSHPELSIERLTMLRNIGFRISLDDFGTGYSSLSYLKHIPAHELKLDRSFVVNICEDPSDERLVRAVIDLARDMGISTVAEGVETEDVALRLRDLGCDKVQGYFYSRPLDATSFEQWFHKGLLD